MGIDFLKPPWSITHGWITTLHPEFIFADACLFKLDNPPPIEKDEVTHVKSPESAPA